jgi:Uma2 family endonuclease
MMLKHDRVPDESDLIWEPSTEPQGHSDMAMQDLLAPLEAWLQRTGRKAFVGSNSPLGYERGRPAIGPDLYVINGGIKSGQIGWAPWRENGLMPNLIIEFLSPSTEAEDRGTKMVIARDVFKAADYILFQSSTGGVEFYRLKDGEYVRKHADKHGRFRCASLPLWLGVVKGRLRWFERDGHMLPNADELASASQQLENRAQQLENRAQQLESRAQQAEAENQRLRDELERLRRGEGQP